MFGEHSPAFDAGQRNLLEQIATGAPLPGLLEGIVRFIESQADGMLCSILLLDEEHNCVRAGAAPSLPAEYSRELDGFLVGPTEGSCGAAASRGERVIVEDIATHPYWDHYKQLALPHGLRACWSSPIFSPDRKVLGTFAMYYLVSRGPTEVELSWVDAATHIAAIAILRDRSDQLLRQSEARYRHSEQRMRAVIENTPNVCVQWYDRRGRVLFANRISRELFGWSELDAIGKTLDQLNFTAPETDRFMEALNDVANTGRVRGPMEFGFVRPDGSPGTLLSTVFRISSPEADHDYCYVCMDVDLTDYKRAQEKLVANERLRAFVYDHVADPIFHLTREGDALFRFSTVNVAFCSATGLEERTVVGKLVHEVIPEPSCSMVLAKYAQAIATRAPVSWEEITPYPSGLKYGEVTVAPTFDAAGVCTGLVGTVHDVTARKRAEEERSRLEAEFHHAQRMLALGTFAGGIAHDFNNLLTVMRGQTEIALIEVEARDSRSMRAHLEEIRTASMRATELVRQILTFSRKQEPRRELLAPAAIVDEALRLLRSTLPRSIEVVLNIASDVPRVNADPTQLLQVVMNLGQNAAHATLSQQGTIEIALDALHLQALVGVGGRTLGAGRYVRLRVIDHGCGMDDATLQRVFEPFFTTKGPERGTGLGLSVVLDIVKHHGGAITVDSRVGQGTTFSMYLPAA